MGLKDAYLGIEDKWYALWEKTPLIGVIDAVDSVIPSFLLFLLLIVVLIAFGAFFALSQNQVFDATFTVRTSDNSPVNDTLINAKLMENGVLIKNLSARTDSAGELTFPSIKMGQELDFDLNLGRGTFQKTYTINGPLNEVITLAAPPLHFEPVVKTIFVKTASGMYARDPIDLAFSCANSSAVPDPQTATFSGTTGVQVTEPTNCQLVASVNNPKYQQKSYTINSTMYDLYLEDYTPPATTIKIMVREGGYPVNGTDFQIKLTGQNTYTTDTGSASEATLQVSPGNYFVSVSDPRGNYGVASQSVSVFGAAQTTITVSKSIKARVTITVFDSQTHAVIAGAIVNLKDSSGREIETEQTGSDGTRAFTFTDLGDYTFTAKKPGDVGTSYFPKSVTQTLTGDANISIGIDPITTANAGLTNVTVTDQDGLPVANAKVMLKYKADDSLVELLQAQNYSFTDINGTASLIAGNPNGQVYAYAIKGPFNGASTPKQIFVDSQNSFTITTQVGSSTINVNVVDETGAKVNGTAEVLLVDGSAPSDHGIAGLISMENGTVTKQIKAGQSIYLRLKAGTYEDYYTAPIMLWPDKAYNINVTMLKQISAPAVRLAGSGVFNENDAAVQTLAPGKKYYALFRVDSGLQYNQVIFNFRAGNETLLENDILQIEGIDAGGMDSQLRGTSYDPAQGYSFDGANTTDGPAKWVNAKWNDFGAGTREVKVWFSIKNTAPQNAPIQFYWRASFDNTRVPASTASQDFYADSSPSNIYYVGTEAVCTDGFCANSEWLYSTTDQLYVNEPYSMRQVSPYTYHFSLLNNTGIDYGSGARQKAVTLSIKVLGDSAGAQHIKIDGYEIKNPVDKITNNTPLYSAENLPITSFEKDTVLDSTLTLEGIKYGADAISFELKSEGQIIYSKEIPISVVREKDFNVGISPQFIPAMLNTLITVNVTDETGNYLPGAAVRAYAKEPGFDPYLIDSATTNRAGAAVINSGAYMQNTQIIIEIIKEGYSRQSFTAQVSKELITASPSELYVQLNTYSKRNDLKTISFSNLSKYDLVLKQIVLDSKFKDVINEDALKANFDELSNEQKTVKAENSLDVDLLKIQLANGITSDNFVEPITVNGSAKVVFEEPTTKLTYDVTLPLRVDVSSSANPDASCLIINPTSKTSMTTENAQVQYDFEMINACASDGANIPLDTLTVTAPAEIPGTAEISIRNSTGTATGITALDGGKRKLLDKINAGEKLYGVITFAPGPEALGKSVQLSVSYTAKFNGDVITSNPQTVTYTANVVNLKECMHIDGDSAPVAFSDKAKVNIDTTACLGQMIDVILCYGDSGCSGGADGKISLSEKAFTLQNKTEQVQVYNPTYPGTYGVSVYARTRGNAGFTYIGEVPVSFLEKDSQYFNLNKFELNLVGVGSKDAIILSNKMLTTKVNVKADECIWGKQDAEFNWANGIMGAMMGAMVGNLIGSAYHPAPSTSGSSGSGNGGGNGSATDPSKFTPDEQASASQLNSRVQSIVNQPIPDLEQPSPDNLFLDPASQAGSLTLNPNAPNTGLNETGSQYRAQYTGTFTDPTGQNITATRDIYYDTSTGKPLSQAVTFTQDNSGRQWVYNSPSSASTFGNDYTAWKTSFAGKLGSSFIGPALKYAQAPFSSYYSTSTNPPYGTPINNYSQSNNPSGAWQSTSQTTQITSTGASSGSPSLTTQIHPAPFVNTQPQGAHFAAPAGGGTNWVQLSLTVIGALIGGYLMGNANLYKCADHFDVVPMDAFVILLQGTTISVSSPSGGGANVVKALPPDARGIQFTLSGIDANWDFSDAQYSSSETVGLSFANTGINDPKPRYGTLTVNANMHQYGNLINLPGASSISTSEFDYDIFCHNNTFGRYWFGGAPNAGQCTGVTSKNYAQKYHLRVLTGEPQAEDAYLKKATTCYMGAMTGATGPDALPRVKLDWDWSAIDADTCDYTNENHYYCDATQFTIALTKKLSALDEFLAKNGGSFNCPPDQVQQDVQATIDELNTHDEIIPSGTIGVKDISLVVNSQTNHTVATITVLNNTGAPQTSYLSAVWKGSGDPANDMKQLAIPAGESTVVFEADTPKYEGINYFIAAVNGPYGNRQSVTSAFLNREDNNACWIPQTTESIGGMPGLLYYVAAIPTVTTTPRIPDSTALYNHLNFGVYLTKDAFSEDFFKDFKQYYLNTVMQESDQTERKIVDYLTSGNFKIVKKFSGENTIEPGLYDVWIKLNAPGQFRVIDGNNTTIDVELLLVKTPAVDSPFYSMPIDGLLGEKGGRQGYGSTFRNGDSANENAITISNPGIRYYTFYNSASNGVTNVTTQTTTTFDAVNSAVGTRGQLGAVSVSGNEAQIAITPNFATPIIAKQHIDGTSGNFALTVDNASTPLITRGNLTYWTGAARSKDFFGANAVESYADSPDYRLSKLGENIFGFEYNDITRPGDMYLKTIMFTPVQRAGYVLSSKDNGTSVWTPDSGEFGSSAQLAGINEMPYNHNSSYIQTLEDLFKAVTNNEVCVSSDGANTSFWWNPAYVETAQGATVSQYQEELNLVGGH